MWEEERIVRNMNIGCFISVPKGKHCGVENDKIGCTTDFELMRL